MHHQLVTSPVLALLLLLSGCSQFTTLTGRSVAGGQTATQSKLLDVPLPAGMEFYATHSAISGTEGLETLRGTVSPATCAMSLAQSLQDNGWHVRLSKTLGSRAFYLFEKDSRLACIHIRVQSPPALTLVEIAAGHSLPDGSVFSMPKTNTPSASGTSQPSEPQFSTAPLQDSGGSIKGRDI